LRSVTTGVARGDRVEILGGVKSGERVIVTRGAYREGELVRISS
jgi:multidrug efflux pump subunit AcrA (membrane-fusion protein)